MPRPHDIRELPILTLGMEWLNRDSSKLRHRTAPKPQTSSFSQLLTCIIYVSYMYQFPDGYYSQVSIEGHEKISVLCNVDSSVISHWETRTQEDRRNTQAFTVILQSQCGISWNGLLYPVIFMCITGVTSYSMTITLGRDDFTLRDHPVFFRDITREPFPRGIYSGPILFVKWMRKMKSAISL